MAIARFYHLTRDPPEALLPQLLGKSLEAGLRVALRAAPGPRLEALDRALWAGEGFLPHGVEGGPHDADQPVLLTATDGAAAALPNRPGCLIALDQMAVTPEEAQAMERLCILFDGTDPQAVEAARAQWRMLTRAGIVAEYWSQDGGRWTCAARHPPQPAD
jgi:DNA polymerase-3 subunit chi